MKILVTGGLGHIGSKLIRDLAHRNNVEKVRILDNVSTERYPSLFNLPKKMKYEFIHGNILNKNDLNLAMKDMDTVIHLAAITDAPSSFTIKEKVEEVNVKGTELVINATLKHYAKKFIYLSTTSVYGPTTGIAREDCEKEDLNPQSPYAETKLKGEHIISEKAKEADLDATIYRFGTIFGPSPGMRFHTAINKFVYLACFGKPLTVWENAVNQKRPYLDLRDGINAIFFALENKKTKGEIFNVVTINATVQEVINSIREFIPTLKIEYTKSPLINQMSYFTDDSKIRNLGFKYCGNLMEAIEETINLLR